MFLSLNADVCIQITKFLTIPDMFTWLSVNKMVYDVGTKWIGIRCNARTSTRREIIRFYLAFQGYVNDWKHKRYRRMAVPLWGRRRSRTEETPILMF